MPLSGEGESEESDKSWWRRRTPSLPASLTRRKLSFLQVPRDQSSHSFYSNRRQSSPAYYLCSIKLTRFSRPAHLSRNQLMQHYHRNGWLKVKAESDGCKLWLQVTATIHGWKWWVQLLAAYLLLPFPVSNSQLQKSWLFLENVKNIREKNLPT